MRRLPAECACWSLSACAARGITLLLRALAQSVTVKIMGTSFRAHVQNWRELCSALALASFRTAMWRASCEGEGEGAASAEPEGGALATN